MNYLLVGIAGIIGASLRYLAGIYFEHWRLNDFPLATFLTNLAGSFALGWLTTFLPRFKFLHPYAVTAIGTGLVGSFTTFSTFSIETIHLIMISKWGLAVVYVLLSLWGGLIFSWIGYRLGTPKDVSEIEVNSK